MKRFAFLRRALLPSAFCFLLMGCHSAHVDATISNHSGGPISLIEVDYPSASFGKETLSEGQTFHYRFKAQGAGPTRLLWTDASRQQHTVAGPDLDEKSDGSFLANITGANAQISFTPARNK